MKPITERVLYHSVKGRRPSNQDAVVVGVLTDGRAVTSVADGMGGRLAGDVASRRTLEVLIEILGGGGNLISAVERANQVVYQESQEDVDLHGMGTTVVALLQDGNEYSIANVGDSRAYRVAADGISRMTADHSFTAEAIESGDMTPEDALLTPWANALTRAVGTDDTVEVDLFGPFDATEPHMVLLCSDGFYKPLTDDGIFNSVLGCDSEANMAAELVDVALRAGSDDNVTVALVSFGDTSWVAEAVKHRAGDQVEDNPTVEFIRFSGAGSDPATVESDNEPNEEDTEGETSAPVQPEAREPDWVTPDPTEEEDVVGDGEVDSERSGEDPAVFLASEPRVSAPPLIQQRPGVLLEEDLPDAATAETADSIEQEESRPTPKRALRDSTAGFQIVMPPEREFPGRPKRSKWLPVSAFLLGVVALVFVLMSLL